MITKIEKKILEPLIKISKELYYWQIKHMENGIYSEEDMSKLILIHRDLSEKKKKQIGKIAVRLDENRIQIKIRFQRMADDLKFLKERLQ